MKTKIWITGTLIALNMSAFAQFKGLITYDVQVTLPEEMAAAAAMMPSQMKIASDGTEIATEMDGMQGTHMLTNSSEKMIYVYSKAQGIGMKTTMDPESEETREDLADMNIQVSKLDQTKTILDYECTGYLITTDKATSEIYVTAEIDLSTPEQMGNSLANLPEGVDIEGFPLYVKTTVNQDGQEIVMVMEVTAIDEGTVPEEMMTLRDVEYVEME